MWNPHCPPRHLWLPNGQVEASLRQRYAGYTRLDFLKLPVMAAYVRYYRSFDKTYHVLLQVEFDRAQG